MTALRIAGLTTGLVLVVVAMARMADPVAAGDGPSARSASGDHPAAGFVLQADADADGIDDTVDNCPVDPNPGQEDTDIDAEGDVCDLDDGLILMMFVDNDTMVWQQEAGYDRFNIYRGDLDLLRAEGLYTQDPAVHPGAERFCDRTDGSLVDAAIPFPGQRLFYLADGEIDGVEMSLGAASDGSLRTNANPCMACRPMTTVVHTGVSNLPAQTRVIGSLAEWCAFWPRTCGSGLVDFTTEVVVVNVLGTFPDSCHDTTITCVQQNLDPGDVTVHTMELYPEPGCTCFTIITSPMHAVKVKRPITTFMPSGDARPLDCP